MYNQQRLMNKFNMIRPIKLSILAVTVSTAILSAQAYNGDLLVGFSAGASGTDLIFDLGTPGSLINGQTWDLSSELSGYDLNTVMWGVIGLAKISGTYNSWTTDASGTPGVITGLGGVSPLNEGLTAMNATTGANSYYTIGASTEISWYHETILGGSGEYNSGGANNPNTEGLTTVNFYDTLANGSAPELLNTFTLGPDGVLTYGTPSPTPEPATCGLFGLGTLAVFSARRFFRNA
jgi:hypothetical protein